MNQSTTHNRPNISEKENNSKDNPIRATDRSRNDERDQRVRNETDTERLRSERQSVNEKQKK